VRLALCALLYLWWAVRNDFRTPTPIISITYERKEPDKASIKPKKHAIHKAINWQKMLDSGLVKSRSEIARAEGLTPARVTQVMNLLKLPSEVKDFLTRLKDPKDVRKYSERKLLSGSISVPKKDDKGSSTNGSNLIS
jgi:hypothetical protein